MTTKKTTKREYFTRLMNIGEVKNNKELTAFITHEIELLDRKNGTRKPTAVQLENEKIKNEIVAIMTAHPNTLYTVTNIVKAVEGDYTTQKISALMRQLVEENKVERIEDKRKTVFRLAR